MDRDRDGLRAFLDEQGIGTEVYYPVPLHLQECYADLGYTQGDFPVSEAASERTLALPIFAELHQDQIVFVVEQIKTFLQKIA